MQRAFSVWRTSPFRAMRNYSTVTRLLISAFAALSFAVSASAHSTLPVIEIHAARYAFSPSEITLKQGQPVELVFVADDVPHGIVVKALAIDLDLPRHKPRRIIVTPATVGNFSGECSHYCGNGHDRMALVIHVRS